MLDPSAVITGMGYRRPPGDCLIASFETYLLKFSMGHGLYHLYCLEATVYIRVLESISENIF